MIKNKNIVVVGLQPWDIEIGSNCKNIAQELAKWNKVLYVNAPIDRNTLIRGKRNKDSRLLKRLDIIKKRKGLQQLEKNLWNLYPSKIINSINWIPATSVFKLFNYFNNKRFASEIAKAAKELGFDEYILFNDSDMFRSFYLKEFLKPTLYVYYTRDNLMAVDYWRKHGATLEPALMKKSDLVVANSGYLASLAKKSNTNAHYVGQGCDLTIFDPQKKRQVPEDIKNIPGPLIGYIGAILSARLNLPLLLSLCKKKKEWNFVFVGNADEAFSASGLFDMENVFYLGLKEMEQLPDYLACFDVAINPQILNELTIGNYPRKIDEYLAMGKPVVATQTATMEAFKDVVYLGETADDYANMIERALGENNAQKVEERINFANSHTWENSVKSISDAIETTLI